MSFYLTRKTVEPLLTIVCPTLVCILMGLLTFGTQVFHLKSPPFQFVTIGLAVGILVLAAQRLALIQFVGATILLIIVMIVTTGSGSPRLIPHVIAMLFLAGAALLNVKILVKIPLTNVIGQFLTWSIVFILAYLLHGVILLMIFRPAKIAIYFRIYWRFAVLIGIGLGIGFKLKDWLIQKLYVDKPEHISKGDGL
jgi:hypothetical protein